MKRKFVNPERMRQYLITFAICLSYVVFSSMGIIIAKHNPQIFKWVDFIIIPLSISTMAFIYLFAISYEKRLSIKIDDLTIEIIKKYGEGKSFETIKEELNLNHIQTVKNHIIRYCKLKEGSE